MTRPSFVHLRLHSEYSIVDGTLRIDEAVAAAAADGMPALALTDLANAFGLIKFYKAARAARRQADRRLRRLDHARHRARRAVPRDPAAPPIAPATCGSATGCTRAYRTNQHRGRAELRREWFAEGTDGLIALSGGRDRRRRRGARCRATPQRRGKRGARLGRVVSAAVLPRSAARGPPRRRGRWSRRPSRSPPTSRCRSSRRIRCSSARATTSGRTRRASASPRVTCSPTRGVRAASRPTSTSRRRRRWRERFADLPEALANSVAIAQRCNLTIPLGKAHLPEFPTPAGVTIDDHLRDEAAAGLERRLARLYPDAATRDAKRPQYDARLEFETKTIIQMGFAGYFLIVADFINWAPRQPRAGRAGTRVGRGLARRVLARHHRPRSAALLADLRALPQSGTRVDARFRHRLLPGRPRPRHRLRQEEVRRGFGVADRDVRHARREGGGPRRRPRARPALPVRRRHREADPVPAGQARHAAAPRRRRRRQRDLRARGRAAHRRARGCRGGSAAAARAGRAARGPAAQRRHARGRRADRAGPAHRLLPALRAAERRGDPLAVRQGRRRGGRPREVRLPGPHDADDPRLDASAT